MFRNLFTFKRKKSIAELRHEQYVSTLNSVSSHYTGVKINDTLVGKISGTRMDDIISTAVENKPVDGVKTTPRPKAYNMNMFEWLADIRKEAKNTMNQNHANEKIEKEQRERLLQIKQQKAIKETREFYVNYGVLSK